MRSAFCKETKESWILFVTNKELWDNGEKRVFTGSKKDRSLFEGRRSMSSKFLQNKRFIDSRSLQSSTLFSKH